MQRIQRKVGSFLPRGEDDAQVAAMLAEFKEVDQMLGKLVDATSHWREAWAHILSHELNIVTEFEALYRPIAAVGETSLQGHIPAETPREILERTRRSKELYNELKTEMMEEVNMIDRRLIKPAQEAKQNIKPMHKVIQKREDKKLDYERYKSRVEKLEAQANRSARDESALAKHRIDMERCETEYEAANSSLLSQLPHITAAVISLLPYLLAAQIEIQNSILGNMYTLQHEYCEEYGFPSPPPDMADVVADWDATFTPLRKEVESGYQLLAHSKVVHQPMEMPDTKHGTVTGLNLRNTATDKFANRPRIGGRPSFGSHNSGGGSPNEEKPPPKPPRPRNSFSNAPPSPDHSAPPPVNLASRPKIPMASKPRIGSTTSNTLSPYDGAGRRPSSSSAVAAYSPGSQSQQGDYFHSGSPSYSTSPGRTHSAVSLHSNGSASTVGGVATPLQGIAAGIGKKKPPPPPPPKKRLESFKKEDFVTAMYDFDGQGPGDLSFREGDRIKVLKREGDATDSWWQGELRGVKGSFPANYCQ
ncbi:hypothetical protein B0J12DRAFT_279622 [Macrophomina phaseolina]|uniref:SH3 domain-containing protein n=1 Tax=Macrophomina phaseolina TaxID=35725 RepID=A0ABQ8GMQ5_9PEZI|nr:hypothetical protein B0J12DRAFT_279622 [Macrophomina phaseolina]